MKLIGLVMMAGLILLYFIDTAFKLPLMNREMLTHSALRFFTGFLLIGIGVFHAHKIKLKNALYLILALMLADDILDYFRNVHSFNFEVLLHSMFMLLWGALMGYVVMKQSNKTDGL
jgi:hypothetical protein